MDDFLYNLRAGKTGNFDRNRRPYGGNQNRGGKDYKKSGIDTAMVIDQLSTLISETLPAIKTLLENIDDNNKRLADNGELLVKAEERKATALEAVASYFKSIPDGQEISPKLKPSTKMPEEERRNVLNMIDEMKSQNMSFDAIALRLEEKGIGTFSGRGKWRGQTIHRLIRQK